MSSCLFVTLPAGNRVTAQHSSTCDGNKKSLRRVRRAAKFRNTVPWTNAEVSVCGLCVSVVCQALFYLPIQPFQSSTIFIISEFIHLVDYMIFFIAPKQAP